MPLSRPEPEDDRTPLMHAACADDLDVLQALILSGVELDRQCCRQWTALTYACWHGHYEIAAQLLDSGADPDVHDSYSFADTPLSIAARAGDFAIVRLLIAHDADPNCYAGVASVRPEWYARQGGHGRVAEFLRGEEDKRNRA